MRPIALALLTILATAATLAASVGEARAGSDFAIDVEISGSTAIVKLNEVHKTVGALELVIKGAGPVEGDCEFVTGFGACSNNGTGDDEIVVAMATTDGWGEPAELARVPLASPPDPLAVSLDLVTAADIDAQLIEGTVGLTAASGRSVWVWIGAAAVVSAAIAGLLTLRRQKRHNVTEA